MTRRRSPIAHDGLARHVADRITHAEARTRIDQIAEITDYPEALLEYLIKTESGERSEFEDLEHVAFDHVLDFLRHRDLRDLLAGDTSPAIGSCCLSCGATMSPRAPGRPGRTRKYCSSPCRQRAYRSQNGAQVRRSPLWVRFMMEIPIEAVRKHPDDEEHMRYLQNVLRGDEPCQPSAVSDPAHS